MHYVQNGKNAKWHQPTYYYKYHTMTSYFTMYRPISIHIALHMISIAITYLCLFVIIQTKTSLVHTQWYFEKYRLIHWHCACVLNINVISYLYTSSQGSCSSISVTLWVSHNQQIVKGFVRCTGPFYCHKGACFSVNLKIFYRQRIVGEGKNHWEEPILSPWFFLTEPILVYMAVILVEALYYHTPLGEWRYWLHSNENSYN